MAGVLDDIYLDGSRIGLASVRFRVCLFQKTYDNRCTVWRNNGDGSILLLSRIVWICCWCCFCFFFWVIECSGFVTFNFNIRTLWMLLYASKRPPAILLNCIAEIHKWLLHRPPTSVSLSTHLAAPNSVMFGGEKKKKQNINTPNKKIEGLCCEPSPSIVP